MAASADECAPRRALEYAGAILDSELAPYRTRAVARLLRYAIESAVDGYWELRRPGEVVGRSGRGREIRLLAAELEHNVVHHVYATWCQLSDAARPHAYDLPVSVEELRVLERKACDAVVALTASSEPASGACCTSCRETGPAG